MAATALDAADSSPRRSPTLRHAPDAASDPAAVRHFAAAAAAQRGGAGPSGLPFDESSGGVSLPTLRPPEPASPQTTALSEEASASLSWEPSGLSGQGGVAMEASAGSAANPLSTPHGKQRCAAICLCVSLFRNPFVCQLCTLQVVAHFGVP
jgi:hypothetical protein